MTTYELQAEKRTILGKKVKQLRKKGVVPGNVFGKKTPSVAIQVDHKALVATLKKAGETSLVNVKIAGETKARPVLVAGYAQNPVTGELLHVDFHEVDLNQKTTAMVPVKVVGESEVVKSGNVLVMLKNEIEVEALPTDLPESLEIDITSLTEVGATLHAKDLKVDRSKVTLSIEDEEPIVTVQEPAKEEVVEAPVAEGSEAAPAEGEAKAPETAAEPEKKD